MMCTGGMQGCRAPEWAGVHGDPTCHLYTSTSLTCDSFQVHHHGRAAEQEFITHEALLSSSIVVMDLARVTSCHITAGKAASPLCTWILSSPLDVHCAATTDACGSLHVRL